MTGGVGPLRHLEEELGRLAEEGLLREPLSDVELHGLRSSGLLVLCSNDYLGYSSEPLGLEGIAELT